QGAPFQDVSISGTNFTSAATVSFGSSDVTVSSVTFMSSTWLIADVSVTSSAVLGNRTVSVTVPTAGSGSCSTCFSISDTPAVLSLQPAVLPQGAANQVLSVSGRSFMAGATASFPAG